MSYDDINRFIAASGSYAVKSLISLAISALFASFALSIITDNASAQEESVFQLAADGESYEIPYTITTGSELRGLELEERGLVLTATIESSADGELKLQLPRSLADNMGNPGELVVFVDLDYSFQDL